MARAPRGMQTHGAWLSSTLTCATARCGTSTTASPALLKSHILCHFLCEILRNQIAILPAALRAWARAMRCGHPIGLHKIPRNRPALSYWETRPWSRSHDRGRISAFGVRKERTVYTPSFRTGCSVAFCAANIFGPRCRSGMPRRSRSSRTPSHRPPPANDWACPS